MDSITHKCYTAKCSSHLTFFYFILRYFCFLWEYYFIPWNFSCFKSDVIKQYCWLLFWQQEDFLYFKKNFNTYLILRTFLSVKKLFLDQRMFPLVLLLFSQYFSFFSRIVFLSWDQFVLTSSCFNSFLISRYFFLNLFSYHSYL